MTLTDVDEAAGAISVVFGRKDKPTKPVNVPLADGTRLVASHVIPTIKNHLPFEWRDLRPSKGGVVSIRVRASEDGISVTSICERQRLMADRTRHGRHIPRWFDPSQS